MDWELVAAHKKIINHFSKFGKMGNRDILEKIPVEYRSYKCHTCHGIVDKTPCPNCGETHLEIMCPLDHCHCGHDVISKIEYCPVCGQECCPECGTHAVLQLSRVTGYLQDVSGWNDAKKQELKDRHRYDVES